MKRFKLLLGYALCMLLPVFVFCDANAQLPLIDTSVYRAGQLSDSMIAELNAGYAFQNLGVYEPDYSSQIQFNGENTYFYLSIQGDSLVWGGNMKLSESASTFINFCDEYWYSKIDSLETELAAIRKKYCR